MLDKNEVAADVELIGLVSLAYRLISGHVSCTHSSHKLLHCAVIYDFHANIEHLKCQATKKKKVSHHHAPQRN